MSIEFKIRELIHQKGYITCDQLMKEALSVNPTSYYKHIKDLGSKGDFTTAPEISQLFGEVIGLWAIKEWHKLGCPRAINLVELGPGKGLLIRDLLRTVKLVPDFYKALTIELIEINQNFIDHQKENLKDFDLSIMHYQTVENIAKKPAIIIANEFFDALPIKQYVKVKESWYERVFVIEPGDNKIKFSKITINQQLQSYLLKTHLEANDGAIFEESYESISVMKFISGHLKNFGGSSLIIDYGYDINPNKRTRYQYNPTIQAVMTHQYSPILDNLGEADISAHVDFNALKMVAKNTKINVINTISQRDFLIQNGILLRAKTLKDKLDAHLAEIIKKQVDRLILPKQMGNLFKVLQING